MKTEEVICPYCNSKAEWVDNALIYGKRYGRSYMMYWCRPCDALVGCHNNTRIPLGTLANKELRRWRMKAHAVFDPLWKTKKVTRDQAYYLVKLKTGKYIHMGESTIEDCKLVISALTKDD